MLEITISGTEALAAYYQFDGKKRRLRYGPHFIHLIVRALLYGNGIKQVSLTQLGDAYGDPDFLSSDDNEDDDDEQQALYAHLDRL
jgi:hypothetical protein